MTIILYGIPNCDTVKKARTWLSERGVAHDFHDYKKLGIDPDRLSAWSDRVGWETLLNKAGTTFRKLPDTEKHDIDRDRAIALMAQHPSLIRRPVVEGADELLVGFKADDWARLLG